MTSEKDRLKVQIGKKIVAVKGEIRLYKKKLGHDKKKYYKCLKLEKELKDLQKELQKS